MQNRQKSPKMFHKILVIIALVLVAQSTSEITRKQWTKINRLLLHGPILPPNARTCLDNNIYKKYHKWATNYAIKYRVKHQHKCRHVTLQEIQHYAEQGLLTAIQQFGFIPPFGRYKAQMIFCLA